MLTHIAPKRGFSLLELIVVLVILGLLASIAIPTYERVIERSEDKKTEVELKAVSGNARALWMLGQPELTPGDALEQAASEVTYSAGAQGVVAAEGQANQFTATEARRASTGYGDIVYIVVQNGGVDQELIDSSGVVPGDVAFSMMSPSGNFCWAAFGPTTDIYPVCGTGVTGSPDNPGDLGNGGGTPAVQLPGKVTGLAGTAGNTTAQLSWTPLSSGTVTGYHVYLFDETTPHGAPIAGDAFLASGTVSGLINGQPYVIRIAAYNSRGDGPLSDPIVVTPETGPSVVEGVTVTAGVEKLYVRWADNNYTGAPVDNWEVFVDGISYGQSAGKGQAWKLITGLTPGQEYTITVVAHGITSAAPSAPVTGTPFAAGEGTDITFFPPSAPGNLVAVGRNSAVTLAWPPSEVNTFNPVSSYSIYVINPADGQPVTVSPSDAVVTESRWMVTITNTPFGGLVNGTQYSFYVVANGPGGSSAATNTATATPNAAVTIPTEGSSYLPPATAPTLSGIGGNSTATLSWTKVPDAPLAPVGGYHIYKNGEFLAQTNTTNFVVDGLVNDTTYLFEVAAAGPGGRGPLSLPVAVTPSEVTEFSPLSNGGPIQKPGSVTGLALLGGNTKLTARWNRLVSTPSQPVSVYRVYVDGVMRSVVAQTTDPQQPKVEFEITGLTNGQSYAVQVAAVNPRGTGPLSAAVLGTPYGLPGQPTNVTAISPESATVTVSWDDVTPTTAVPVDGYRVYMNGSTTPVVTVPVTQTDATITGLTNGVTYSFQVAAYNSSGNGPTSAAATATPSNPPAPVTVIGAEGAHQRIIVTWAQIAGTPTTPTVGYDLYQDGEMIQRVPQALGSNGLPLANASYTVTGLTNGVAHSFQIRSYNTSGTAGASPVATAAAAPPPAALTWATIGTVTEQNTVTVNWTIGSGGPISAIRVFVNGAIQTTVASDATSATVPLNAGQNNTVQIYAYNLHDTGPASDVLDIPVVAVPNPVNTLAFSPAPGANSTSVTLGWAAPAAGTYTPRTGYKVMVNGVQAGPLLAANATSYTASGLTAGVTYTFTVIATNERGEAAAGANSVSHTPYSLPGQPDGLDVTNESDGKITLNWNEVAGTTAAPVSGYYVYKNGSTTAEKVVSAADSTKCGGGTCSVLIDGLTNGNTYSFQVAAYGTGGTGPTSAAVYGAPMSPLAIATSPVTVPFSDSFSVDGAPGSVWRSEGDVTVASGNLFALGSSSILAGATPNSDLRFTTSVTNATTFNVIFRAADADNFWMLRRYNVNGLAFPCQTQLVVVENSLRTVVNNVNGGASAGASCASAPVTGNITVATFANGTMSVSGPGYSYNTVDSRHVNARGLALQAGKFNAVYVTATPGAAGSFAVAANSGSSATATWTAGDGATSYTVTATDPTGTSPGGTCSTATLSCSINTLTRAHTYNLSLVAVRDGLLSPEQTTTITMPSEFAFSSFGDANGVLYYLGTRADTAVWFNPSDSGFAGNYPSYGVAASAPAGTFNNAMTTITDRNTGTSTGGVYSSGRTAQITLPAGRSVSPSDVAIRFAGLYGAATLSASNDGTTWDQLGTSGVSNSAGMVDIRLTTGSSVPYRMFRVAWSHPNPASVGGSPSSLLAEFEVYGQLYDFELAPPSASATGGPYKNTINWSGGTAGEWVVKRAGNAIATVSAGTTSYVDTAAPTGVASTYTVVPRDPTTGTLGQPSAPVSATAYVPAPPSAPTDVSITKGLTNLNVNFTAGSAGTAPDAPVYTATCSSAAGTVTGSASSSPITIGGVDVTTDGLTYACSVTAATSDGSSTSTSVSYTIQAFSNYLSSLSPTNWWTHTQPAGTTTVPAQAGSKTLAVNGGVTFGAGAITAGRTSADFNGTTGYESLTSTALGNFTISSLLCTGSSIQQGIIYAQRPTGTFSNAAGTGQISFHLLSTGKLELAIGTNAGTMNRLTGNVTLSSGTCYSVAAVRSGTTGYLYVNGVLDNSGTLNSNAGQTGHGANIGRDPRDLTSFFKGRIGDLAIWSGTALQASQIAALHANSGL